MEYLVEWEGDSGDTWETEEALNEFQEMVQEFKAYNVRRGHYGSSVYFEF